MLWVLGRHLVRSEDAACGGPTIEAQHARGLAVLALHDVLGANLKHTATEVARLVVGIRYHVGASNGRKGRSGVLGVGSWELGARACSKAQRMSRWRPSLPKSA